MKILFLLHSSGKNEGSSIAVLSIIQQMKKYGNTLHVVCPRTGRMVETLNQIGIETTIIKYANAIYPKIFTKKSIFSWPIRLVERIWYNHTAEKKLCRLVSSFHPDIIHTNVGVLRVGYYVAKKMGIPHVWHIRETEIGLLFHHYPSYRYQCKLLKDNNYNIAITESVKLYYSLNEKNSKVIYDGVISNKYNPPKITKEKYFLFVGRITKSKGPDWAINAFLKVIEQCPDTELWLAGTNSGPFAKTLIDRVSNSKGRNRIKFLGQRNDIYDLMTRAMAVLVPSICEGFGFITVEAMANRTIVIGRNTGGTKEQFDNGLKLTGQEIALRCESEEDMASHMIEIYKKGEQHWKEMINSAESVVKDLYTVENNTKQIIDIYKKLRK